MAVLTGRTAVRAVPRVGGLFLVRAIVDLSPFILALAGALRVSRTVFALPMFLLVRLYRHVRVGFRMITLAGSIIVLRTATVITAAVARALTVLLDRTSDITRSPRDHPGTGAGLSRIDRWLFILTVGITIDF